MAAETLLPTWLPTWHGLMFTNGLPLEEIRCHFRQQWKLDHQVDVRQLDEEQDIEANLNSLTSYANKFHTTTSLVGNYSDPWPITWETKFFGWINSVQRNAFESIRMSVNQFVPHQSTNTFTSAKEVLPMPSIYSFTRVPMYNNTGAWR
jgi:hypothetical protein